eukprot:COSAG02_NODE_61108_length_269_cov_0.911765_1_plen_53_part_01
MHLVTLFRANQARVRFGSRTQSELDILWSMLMRNRERTAPGLVVNATASTSES